MLAIDSLATGYDGTVILQPTTAELRAASLTCLLGPNGAGKSTLLRTLAGFQPPLAGEVLVEGRALSALSPSQLSTTISVVLTDRVDDDNLTVQQLVELGRSPYTGFWGRCSEADRKAVDDALQLVGISHLRLRLLHTLSDGERQKAMIAKALAQDTPIIILDEPTAFIDYPGKVELMQLLRRLAHDTARTIFISTHDLEIALRTADYLWLLSRQFGLTTGTPGELQCNGQLTRYFPILNEQYGSKN